MLGGVGINSSKNHGTIVDDDDIKRATGVAVVAAGTTITFTTAFATINYTIDIRCYDASGNNIDFTITNKIAAGFKVTTGTIDVTIDYVCVKI